MVLEDFIACFLREKRWEILVSESEFRAFKEIKNGRGHMEARDYIVLLTTIRMSSFEISKFLRRRRFVLRLITKLTAAISKHIEVPGQLNLRNVKHVPAPAAKSFENNILCFWWTKRLLEYEVPTIRHALPEKNNLTHLLFASLTTSKLFALEEDMSITITASTSISRSFSRKEKQF